MKKKLKKNKIFNSKRITDKHIIIGSNIHPDNVANSNFKNDINTQNIKIHFLENNKYDKKNKINQDKLNRSFDSSEKINSSFNQNKQNLSHYKDEAQDKLFYINNNLGKKMKFNLQKLKYLITSQIDSYQDKENEKNNLQLNINFNPNGGRINSRINSRTNSRMNSNSNSKNNSYTNLNLLQTPNNSNSIQNLNTNLNRSFQSNVSTSRLEKEMQRKVKTILKRDILGRYRKSPYIKGYGNN